MSSSRDLNSSLMMEASSSTHRKCWVLADLWEEALSCCSIHLVGCSMLALGGAFFSIWSCWGIGEAFFLEYSSFFYIFYRINVLWVLVVFVHCLFLSDTSPTSAYFLITFCVTAKERYIYRNNKYAWLKQTLFTIALWQWGLFIYNYYLS